MSFSSILITVARSLIQTKGEPITLQRVAEGSYNVADGTVASGTTTNYSAYGAPMMYQSREVDGTNIKASDVKLYLEKPTSVVPAVGDTVTFNSTTQRVINVEKLRAEGVDIMYILQCRV